MKKELTTQEMAAARGLLDKDKNQADVARETGIPRRTLCRLIKKPKFMAYQNLLRDGVAMAFAEGVKEEAKEAIRNSCSEVKADIAKLELPPLPSQIEMLAKLWAFACVDPALTKGNTDSQRAALNDMWTKMGLDFSGPKVPQTGEEIAAKPNIYKPAWMQ